MENMEFFWTEDNITPGEGVFGLTPDLFLEGERYTFLQAVGEPCGL